MKKVSMAAYAKELGHWGKGLQAQLVRLRSAGLDSATASLAQSLRIDLEAELFRYGKQKERLQDDKDGLLSLQHYDMYAKRYFFLLREVDRLLEPPLQTGPSLPEPPSYLASTFNSRKAKDQARPLAKSVRRGKSRFAEQIEPEWVSQLIRRYSKDKTTTKGHRDRLPAPTQPEPYRQGQLKEVSSQLLELKRLLSDLRDKVDNHTHEDYDQRIDSLKENNRRLFAELTVLREENSTLLTRLQLDEPRARK